MKRDFLPNNPKKKNMLRITVLLIAVFGFQYSTYSQTREVIPLRKDWLFIKGDVAGAPHLSIDESHWKKVNVPHDWAISGPFDAENDQTVVKVIEDGEKTATKKTGRTGGLPYVGVGWYRNHLAVNKADQGKNFSLEFDGAMSHAKVYLNNQFVGEWPYGYASFSFDITKYINFDGKNILAVRLENLPESSRWYPGAGIYREVRLVVTNPIHVDHWGTFITTPVVSKNAATVKVETHLFGGKSHTENIKLRTELFNAKNEKVAENTLEKADFEASNIQELEVKNPQLWAAENPNLYYAISSLMLGDKVIDKYKTIFGIRTIKFTPNEGMLVNGAQTKLKGVCLHHDLGPLGIAVNKSSLRNRLQLLKDMGCNAIRGTHNPHAPEMLELCDEMGFYFIDETFDEWKSAKVENGYHLLFDEWAKKDVEALIFRDRNHPSVIMYSIGNEVREQGDPKGGEVAEFLTAIAHHADATRPVTAGFNNWQGAIKNGLANAVDIPGWNYKPQIYESLHQKYTNWVIYGSETASTVSSRGFYPLPAKQESMKIWPNNQSSSFDLERCSWSQIPDTEWQSQEKNDFVAGEFVWTGMDYLGEPTPYGSSWPSRSSYFGIIDLCGIPKDRYYLYQSHWSTKKMLHILPHWNWEGKEGQHVPVYAYTNYPTAELFINGKSFGKKSFNKDSLLDNYRLRWENAIYQPGEIKVVAYRADGSIGESQVVKTAGKPAKMVLSADKQTIPSNGQDMAFITVSVVDKDGNLCPLADNLISFKVTGNGFLRAVGNGDPTSLASFEKPFRKAFYGKCMVIIQNNSKKGKVKLEAMSDGLSSQSISLKIVE